VRTRGFRRSGRDSNPPGEVESPALSGTSGNGAPELDSAFSGRSDPRSARSDIAPTIEGLADVAPDVAAALGVDEGAVRRVLAMVRDALVDEPELGVTECELAAALRRRM